MKRFSFSLRTLLVVVTIAGVGLASWRLATEGARNRQRLIAELESEKRPLSFELDRSVPQALEDQFYLNQELKFESAEGEPRCVMLFSRVAFKYPGPNPNLIVVTNRSYEVLSSLTYNESNVGSVRLATVRRDDGVPILGVETRGWGNGGSFKRFVLDDEQIRETWPGP